MHVPALGHGADGFGQAVTGADLGVAVGAEHEHRQLAKLGGQVTEEGQRPLVGPVQVVDHGDQALGGGGGQDGGHGLEQPEPVRGARRAAGAGGVVLSRPTMDGSSCPSSGLVPEALRAPRRICAQGR